MTAGSQRAALDAIHSARPIIARLSMARDSEDLAADLIDAWTATETGLRSLVGGSSLTGLQPDTSYVVRVRATSAAGTTVSESLTFRTEPSAKAQLVPGLLPPA